MQFRRVFFLLLVLVFSFGSSGYQTERETPPYYRLELSGLNKRITNEAGSFPEYLTVSRLIERFMARWELKGVSLAVVRDDRLVFAQGFGIANDQMQAVEPGHLFRLASVSKLITAIGIMKLVEAGRLSLDDRVFGPAGILKHPALEHVTDKKLYNITVRDLLVHAGGWTQRYGDPAFLPTVIAKRVGDKPPVGMESYYKFIASSRLHFAPGTMVSYSNMGYMFLGEVIREVSGEPYESYIRKSILIPNGISDMHIGSSYRDSCFSNEVQYFEQPGSPLIPECNGSGRLVKKSDGGNSVELLGAAGGWVASSVELARLLTLIDGKREVHDILSRRSILEMTEDTYGKGPLGWMSVTGKGDWIRTGNMPGTSAMVRRQANGISWVFLTNSSCWKGPKLSGNIERLMDRIIRRIDLWPERDLFQYYPISTLGIAGK
ncbi:MAG: serine hydrolase domain-containing protein [Mangrovibacterium sp.]